MATSVRSTLSALTVRRQDHVGQRAVDPCSGRLALMGTSGTAAKGGTSRRIWGNSRWHRHPGVRTGSQLTTGERAADLVRNGMGSWPFVLAFLLFMAVWAALNGSDGVDPYPFILLNLFLSMIAGLQGAILLISAKRADSISSEVAIHTLTNTAKLQELIEANTALTTRISELATQIHAHVCANDVPGDATHDRLASAPSEQQRRDH